MCGNRQCAECLQQPRLQNEAASEQHGECKCDPSKERFKRSNCRSFRERMQWSACLAGMAIEASMLGAAHAAANPLTASFDVVHGHAVALMLPHVVRFNAEDPDVAIIYRDLMAGAGLVDADADPEMASIALSDTLVALREEGELPSSIVRCGVTDTDLGALAQAASMQWTGQHNPRPVAAEDFVALYGASISQGELAS